MIKQLFSNDLYIQVDKNRLRGKNLSTQSGWQSVTPEKPFTTNRLLIGSFTEAELALKTLVKDLLPSGWFKKSPRIVIHPLVMVEGGLSEIEDRVLMELALGSGAFKVVLHTGRELSDAQVVELLRAT